MAMTLPERIEAAIKSEQKARAYACKTCGESFDAIQPLGVHVRKEHPGTSRTARAYQRAYQEGFDDGRRTEPYSPAAATRLDERQRIVAGLRAQVGRLRGDPLNPAIFALTTYIDWIERGDYNSAVPR